MQYTLLVLSSPADGQCLLTAARFTDALLRAGHTLDTIFFSDAATAVGLCSLAMPQDEVSAQKEWQTLGAEHGLNLVLCIASAMQRGVVDTDGVWGDGPGASTVAEGFSIGGLGQLVAATHAADRVLTFGG